MGPLRNTLKVAANLDVAKGYYHWKFETIGRTWFQVFLPGENNHVVTFKWSVQPSQKCCLGSNGVYVNVYVVEKIGAETAEFHSGNDFAGPSEPFGWLEREHLRAEARVPRRITSAASCSFWFRTSCSAAPDSHSNATRAALPEAECTGKDRETWLVSRCWDQIPGCHAALNSQRELIFSFCKPKMRVDLKGPI